MLGHEKLMAFVATRDLDRARVFYRDTLGLRLTNEDGFALVFDAGGTMLREAGIVFERYDGMKQDKSGIWKSPSGAQVAWFKDPDGNTLSITQF